MIKFVWGNLCVSSSVDGNTNNISLFNVIEQVNVPSGTVFPVSSSVQVQLVFSLEVVDEGENTEFNARIELAGPDGTIISTLSIPINFEKGKSRLRGIIDIPGLKFTGLGVHAFSFFDGRTDSKLGEIDFTVLSLPPSVK